MYVFMFFSHSWIQWWHSNGTLCCAVSTHPRWLRWAGHGSQVLLWYKNTTGKWSKWGFALKNVIKLVYTYSKPLLNVKITLTYFYNWDLVKPCPPSRFAKEYSASPGRGYGAGVIQVLKKLASPHLSDVYQPAREQYNGRGSFGNGGAMRAAPFALGFPEQANVKKVSIWWVMSSSSL